MKKRRGIELTLIKVSVITFEDLLFSRVSLLLLQTLDVTLDVVDTLSLIALLPLSKVLRLHLLEEVGRISSSFFGRYHRGVIGHTLQLLTS